MRKIALHCKLTHLHSPSCLPVDSLFTPLSGQGKGACQVPDCEMQQYFAGYALIEVSLVQMQLMLPMEANHFTLRP